MLLKGLEIFGRDLAFSTDNEIVAETKITLKLHR